MITKYENGAEAENEEVCRYESGAEVEAEAAYKYVDGAEAEVWSSGLEIGGYTLGGFSESMSGISANGEEVRMGFKLGSSETTGVNREIYINIYGNFVNPVISCDITMTCGNATMSAQAVCGFAFYLNDTRLNVRNVVGYNNASSILTGSLSNYTHEGTYDKIQLRLNISVLNTTFRSKTVKAVISNLTIDGKKIKDELVVGSSTYYS